MKDEKKNPLHLVKNPQLKNRKEFVLKTNKIGFHININYKKTLV
jgi:hypothetical protein